MLPTLAARSMYMRRYMHMLMHMMHMPSDAKLDSTRAPLAHRSYGMTHEMVVFNGASSGVHANK